MCFTNLRVLHILRLTLWYLRKRVAITARANR